MDTDIQEVSTTNTSTEAPFSNLGLGFWVPFQPSEVPNFRSFTYDDYSSKHLDLFYEDGYQPPLCSSFDRSKNVVCLKRDSHDIFLQPPLITLPCCIIKGVVGNYIFCIEFPLKQTQESKGWLKTTDFSLSSLFSTFPWEFASRLLDLCQSLPRLQSMRTS
jgi:hypothetical protein